MPGPGRISYCSVVVRLKSQGRTHPRKRLTNLIFSDPYKMKNPWYSNNQNKLTALRPFVKTEGLPIRVRATVGGVL